MVKQVTACAKWDIPPGFLQRLCRSSGGEDPEHGSPLRTQTALSLPALLQNHWCNLIKYISQMSQVAFVNLTTFPDRPAG